MAAASDAAASTALGAPSSLQPSKRFFRAASVMLTVAGTAASLLKRDILAENVMHVKFPFSFLRSFRARAAFLVASAAASLADTLR